MAREFSGEGKKLSTNNPGGFLDLCKMGHVENPSKDLQNFKLLTIAGAYWRGGKRIKCLRVSTVRHSLPKKSLKHT